jgi:hypothetical protein
MMVGCAISCPGKTPHVTALLPSSGMFVANPSYTRLSLFLIFTRQPQPTSLFPAKYVTHPSPNSSTAVANRSTCPSSQKNSTNAFWNTRPSRGPHPTTGSLDSAASTAGCEATVQRPREVRDTRWEWMGADSAERGVGEKGVVGVWARR